MSWRRRVLASLLLGSAALWLTTAAASAQVAGAPAAAQGVAQAAAQTKVAPTVSQVTHSQPVVQATRAAQRVTEAAPQTASVARHVVTSPAAATIAAIAPAVSPPRVPPAVPAVDALTAPLPIDALPAVQTPEPPIAVSDAVDMVLDQAAAITASADEAVDEVFPDAEATLAPVTKAAEATQAVMPVQVVAVATRALEASTTEVEDAPVSPTTDPVAAALTVQAPPIHDVWALERRAGDDHVLAPSTATPAVTIEPIAADDLEAVVPSTPQPHVAAEAPGAETIGENLVISANQPTSSTIPHSAAAFEAQTSIEPALNGSASTDPVLPEPTAPFSALPASIGLSTTAAASWLPCFAQLTVLDTWRPWSQRAPRGRSVVVLPNLAPPG